MSDKSPGESLGDRMKHYESVDAKRLDPLLPIVARLDGRSFSKFTKNMEKPFDLHFTDSMIHTAKYLLSESNATFCYTQSDEISLVFLAKEETSDIFFSGKTQKMCSVLASMAGACFGKFYSKRSDLPHFDCRVFQVPTLDEAANAILWRTLDCQRNAVAQVARSYFTHAALHGVSTTRQLEMLEEISVSMDDYDQSATAGLFLRLESHSHTLSEIERERIPEACRPPAGFSTTRTTVRSMEVPVPFSLVTNRVGVVFCAEEPEFKKERIVESV